MKIKEFKQVLAARNAGWQISDHFNDEDEITSISKPFSLGAIPAEPGAATARMATIRKNLDAPVALWQPNTTLFNRPTTAVLPSAWDWRSVGGHNWVSPAKNQGGCGSCIAFGVSAALETHVRIDINDAAMVYDSSEANLFFVNERQCLPGEPRYGWSIPPALDYLMREGACLEENYPYRDVDQNAELIKGTEKTVKITGYDSTTNTTQMKRWLCEEGPLVTTYTVYEDFDTYWGGGAVGVYTHITGGVRGGHSVAVIGYEDAQSCWICKNSWGSGSVSDGCFRIGYGQCGIDNRMYLIQDPYDVITRDEISYNPRTLRIVNEGARGWLLTDGRSRMKMLDNKEDARNAMLVARRYTRQGFVGRDNPRTKRIDYIMEYWAGDSGLPWEPLTKVDVIPYNPRNVTAEDIDAAGWRIKEGSLWMLLASDLNDALAIMRVVKRYSKMCFIGRGNRRTNRKNYIMTYWE